MPRPVRVEGAVGYVPLTKGYEATVDADLAPVVGRWNWWASDCAGKVYAARTHNKRTVLMHREIIGAAPGEVTDHKDGDGLNNRRENLRLGTHAQNMQNRAGWSDLPKGVSAYGNGYVAKVGLDGRQFQVGGVYETAEAASAVYELFARAIHGDFYRDQG